MMIKKIVFLFLMVVPFLGLGQIKEITHAPSNFVEEIGDLLLEADKKSTREFVEEQWLSQVPAETFNAGQWEEIFVLTDFMLKRRMAPVPYVLHWAEIIHANTYNSSVRKEFDEILLHLNSITKNSRTFQSQLDIFHDLFLKNELLSNTSITWKISKPNFELFVDNDVVFSIKNVDLKCYAKGDSSIIYNTSGRYYPETGKWIGENGRVDWRRAGLDEKEVYAEADKYTISLKSPSFKMDSVLFHHYLFQRPLLGRLDEKILANVLENTADYPRFNSYENRFEIPNIVEGVDFNGGFTMEGGNFNGFGPLDNPARLYFKYKGKTKVEVISQFINIGETSLGANNAKVIIYLAGDSIVHPSLNAKFVKDTRLLTLFRTEKGMEKAPFHNTYHNFDIQVESYKWHIDDPIIDLGAIFGSSSRTATFSSVNYFSEDRYMRLLGLAKSHPLTVLKLTAKANLGNTITVMDFAQQLQLSPTQAEALLINLSIDGFVNYNRADRTALILPKTDQYILSKQGKIDYDVIEFSSSVAQGNNGQLNLENNELKLSGVRFFTLSDSNNVVIFPSNGELILKKDRDIKFGGVVYAGKFEFFGSEYYFDYEEFTINMIAVDSARIKVPSFQPGSDGSRPLVYVTNVIEGIRGSLFIDNPNNKSGLKSKEFAHYPIFDCVMESYVYYDDSRIYNGVYKRDDFFYEIDPYTIDSLETFDTEEIKFEGRFQSAGIFETIDEPLRIMPDYSLGFDLSLPEGGVGIYDDIAKFDNDLSLSGDGLQGNGDLTYFTSTSASEAFTFFPDSVIGRTTSYINTERMEGPEIPEAHASVVDVKFYPFRNMLAAQVYTEPISMYNGQAALREGSLELSTKEMGGNGEIEFFGAFLTSDDFLYRQNDFEADTSIFELASLLKTGLAFKTENVSSQIDFDEMIGKFEANSDETFVEFPENQYICYMDKFNWYIENNNIELETDRGERVGADDFVADTDLEKSASNFFSTRFDQDSLNFLSPRALFNVETSIIDCKEVNSIKVADARVFPDSGQVTILETGRLEELLNAGIVANDVTRYHNLYNADVEILSRFKYKGTGFIDYVDENEQRQQILLTEISVDTALQTIANGKIVSQDEFKLSPYFFFKGDVFMEASREFLVFDGSTRVLHDCEEVSLNWFPFRAEVNPVQIRIPISSGMTSITGRSLASGIVTSLEPYELYPAFLSAKKESRDISLAEASGFITFNTSKMEYQIASQEKLLQAKLPGNLVALNVNSCQTRTDGEFDLGSKLLPLKLKSYGEIVHDPVKGLFSFNTSLLIDFFFNDDALKSMLTELNRAPNSKGINLNKAYYEQSIKEVMGQEASDKLITDLNLSGTFRKFPEQLIHTLYLADVKLVWDNAAEAFKSEGRIGIGSIKDNAVFKSYSGKVMLTKKKTGDRLEIYLELDERKWYYFNYSRGILEAYSSNTDFNNAITDTKDDKRIQKGDKETGDFEYIIASRRKKDNFLERFED